MLLTLHRWDELSHTALLKSVTSLLRKDTRSKVLMVSGLHTGRTKIVSFIRRAHRQGLHLVAFPTNDSLEWPSLSQSEMEVQERQSQIYSSDEALTEASYFIIEMQVLSHESEEASINDTTNSSRVWVAKTPRLSNTRRTFVVHDREEESDDTKDSIHVRNRWITFMALAWQ
jgi:nicotinamide N-methyltransferase